MTVDACPAAQTSQGSDPPEADRSDDHLAGVADGIGCAEIWEHLSASRAGED